MRYHCTNLLGKDKMKMFVLPRSQLVYKHLNSLSIPCEKTRRKEKGNCTKFSRSVVSTRSLIRYKYIENKSRRISFTNYDCLTFMINSESLSSYVSWLPEVRNTGFPTCKFVNVNNIFQRYTFILFSFYIAQRGICREINNKWALERAKVNIAEWYPVVGILDCMEQSINLLEHKFPYFFRGARQIYRKIRKQTQDGYLSDILVQNLCVTVSVIPISVI